MQSKPLDSHVYFINLFVIYRNKIALKRHVIFWVNMILHFYIVKQLSFATFFKHLNFKSQIKKHAIIIVCKLLNPILHFYIVK